MKEVLTAEVLREGLVVVVVFAVVVGVEFVLWHLRLRLRLRRATSSLCGVCGYRRRVWMRAFRMYWLLAVVAKIIGGCVELEDTEVGARNEFRLLFLEMFDMCSVINWVACSELLAGVDFHSYRRESRKRGMEMEMQNSSESPLRRPASESVGKSSPTSCISLGSACICLAGDHCISTSTASVR